MYLHLPLYPLSRPWQGLDKLTGAVCICVTKVGSQPLKQGFYWEWWESWKCLCMERRCISTGLRMQVRTTLWTVSPLPAALDAEGCRLFASVHSSRVPDYWAHDSFPCAFHLTKRQTRKHGMHSLQPHFTGWAMLFISEGKGGDCSEEALLPHQTWWDASSDVAQPPSKDQF